jgi:hypothetical protein
VTVVAAYGMYKLAQSNEDVRDAIVAASEAVEAVTAKGMDIARTAAMRSPVLAIRGRMPS